MTGSLISYGPTLEQKSLCRQKCTESFSKDRSSQQEFQNCLNECKSSTISPNLQKLIFNDLNEKLEISGKNLHDAQNLLSMILAYDINQDSLF
ncbi:hypothetical protein IYZ83_005175 [Wolbachia pipientis]|uniref:hypothetical protein n=1 Tax=Wolbachia pipientis TaxID=955 RepID=UPI001BDA76D3|nr:hypothetical protein [Wolbachia pipientis]UIP91518.1 hypothetical protein IYZ83_005175 [Wolbachia pipientis]